MPNPQPPSDFPADLYMLLGRIEAGQNSTTTELRAARDDIRALEDRMNVRQDDAERRLKAVEIDLGDRPSWKKRVEVSEDKLDEHDDRILTIETTARNARTAIGALWAVFGAGILALGAKLLGLFG